MQDVPVEIEVERVMNLVRGFGWEKVKEEIIDDEIHLEIKTKSPVAGGAGAELEVERVMNLVKGFGWDKVKEELINNVLHLEIMKKSPAAAAAGPGPGPS